MNAAKAIDCGERIQWDELEIDLGKFSQEKLSDLVLSYNKDLSKKDLNDRSALRNILKD